MIGQMLACLQTEGIRPPNEHWPLTRYGNSRQARGRRCSGTDAYRFGGERICSNTQIRAESLEAEIWENVCKIVRNPGSLQQEDQGSNQGKELPDNVDTLRAQRQKLRHGLERLIDSLAEDVIDKDQFTSRMNRTKARMPDIDKKIGAQAARRLVPKQPMRSGGHTCAR
jgi:hypothetical protein